MRTTTTTSTRHLPSELEGREARRLVGFERHYRCSAGHEHRSWTRLRACPGCGESLTFAVIHRAALAK
jgi:hypothetical protein